MQFSCADLERYAVSLHSKTVDGEYGTTASPAAYQYAYHVLPYRWKDVTIAVLDRQLDMVAQDSWTGDTAQLKKLRARYAFVSRAWGQAHASAMSMACSA